MLENKNLYLLGFSFSKELYTFLKDGLEKFQQFEKNLQKGVFLIGRKQIGKRRNKNRLHIETIFNT